MSPEVCIDSSDDVHILDIKSGQPPFEVNAAVVGSGNDIVITIGANPPEDRAVAAMTGVQRSPVGLLIETGGPQDDLACQSAAWLAHHLNANVTVSLGLPLEGLEQDESELVIASFRRLVREINTALGGEDGS